jgi:hypothetical protein
VRFHTTKKPSPAMAASSTNAHTVALLVHMVSIYLRGAIERPVHAPSRAIGVRKAGPRHVGHDVN